MITLVPVFIDGEGGLIEIKLDIGTSNIIYITILFEWYYLVKPV